MSAQQQPGLFARLFGRRQPEHTPWERFREEQAGRQETGETLIEFLCRPASHNPTRVKGARRDKITALRVCMVPIHPPQYLLPPPLPRQQTGAICPVSEPLKPAEDQMPGWAKTDNAWLKQEADWLNSNMESPDVHAEPEQQITGALDALTTLAAQEPDDHTIPALEAIRLKHKGSE